MDGAILRGPELLNPGNRGQGGGEDVLGGDNVKSLLLANASSGSNKNLCFVNGALNIFYCVKEFITIVLFCPQLKLDHYLPSMIFF